jgi:hypothetical protein
MLVSSDRTWSLRERKPLTSTFSHLSSAPMSPEPLTAVTSGEYLHPAPAPGCGPDRRAFAVSSHERNQTGLPPSLRNRHLALLVHNLSVGGRVPEARELADEVRGPINESGDVRARFMLELAESGNFYADGRFAQALALIERALISGESAGDLTRVMLTRQWRCDILMLNDRLDQCLDAAVENVALAQKHHQAWALRVFETGPGPYPATARAPRRGSHDPQGARDRGHSRRDHEHA